MRSARGRLVTIGSAALGSLVIVAAGAILVPDYLARQALGREIAALALGSITRPPSWTSQDAGRCEDLCREFLARWPEAKECWEVKGTLLRMLRLRESDLELRSSEATDLAKRVVKRRGLGPLERHLALDILIQSAISELGTLEDIAALLEEIGEEYSRRLEPLPDGPLRTHLQSRLQSSEYLLARLEVVLGRFGKARAKALVRRGSLPMRWFVDLFQGNLPKTDLEEVDWVTEARLSLREARGSVILLLTHGFTRPKPSGEDLQMLQRIVDARGSEGLTGAIVTFWNKDRNEAEASRLAKSLREDLDYFKVSVPAGLLPSTLMRSLFPRSCGGTCVVVDRDGKFVWETMLRSSLPAEANLTRMVLDRCVGRPISPGWDRAR